MKRSDSPDPARPIPGASDAEPEPTLDGQNLPPGEAPTARALIPGGPATTIDRYKLVKILGTGGFGIVWLAEQTEPIRREVALKIVKPGMDSAEIVARFEAERQVLALMDHPNIAAVLDAGTTDRGLPYFVMEVVHGVPITKYCDERLMTIRERLMMFIPVCQAVQHAHQQGVLHRDLKPSNILVMDLDGQPLPKVIDFGIAKALGTSREQMKESGLALTQTGAAVGTPLYMSPEQADCLPDVDARSDVYTLGVILHELLTGQTIVTKEQLRGVSYGEVLRLIREAETRLPSSRVLERTDELLKFARARDCDPRKLGATIRGDLDWILIRASEKDRERRYRSAAALAQDLQRYLDGEPVEAGPPSAAYRMRKLVARHKVIVMAATITLVAILLGAGGFVWMLARDRERAAKVERSQRELQQRIMLLEQGVTEYRKAEAKVREESPRGDSAEVQDKTYAALSQQLGVDAKELRKKLPEVARNLSKNQGASTFQRANAAYVARDYSEAQRLAILAANEAQKADPPRTGEAIQALELAGWSAANAARLGDASGHFRAAEKLTDKTRNFGEWVRVQHAVTWALYDQGEYAAVERLLGTMQAECERILGAEHPDTLRARHYHARALYSTGRWRDAAKEFREVLALRGKVLGPEHRDTLRSRMALGITLDAAGQPTEGEAMHRETLELQKKALGPDHEDTLTTRMNLGISESLQGRHIEAEANYRSVLAAQLRIFPAAHPDVLRTRGNLAEVLFQQAKYPQAEAEYRDILQIREKTLGPEHPDTLVMRVGLANALFARRKYADAEESYRALLSLQQNILGPEHPNTLTCRANLALTLQVLGKPAQAEANYRQLLGVQEKLFGPDHRETIKSRLGIANARFAQRMYERAAEDYRAVMVQQEKLLGHDHPDTLATIYSVAVSLQGAQQTDEAVKFVETAMEGARRSLGPDHAETKRYERLWKQLQAAK